MRAITGGNTAFFISSSKNFRLLFFILEYIFLVKSENRGQFLIAFLLQAHLSLSYLLHNSMSKELFGEASNCSNKKHEARKERKLNRKNWRGNLLILEMGAWKTFPLPTVKGGETITLPPPCPQGKSYKKESKIFSASSMQFWFQKKQDPLKIVLSLKVAYYKNIQKTNLFFSDVQTRI